MAQSSAGTRRRTKTQAKNQSKAFVARLTDAGEEALQRLSELPGGQRALTAMNDLRTRVDELGKKVRGIEELERRVARLEKQVADLKPKRATATRSSSRRSSTRSSSP